MGAALRGRRGRTGDPEWKARRRLLPNREDLTDTQFGTMWNQPIGTGGIGMTLLTAWIAREKLRDLLAHARTTDRHRAGHLRWRFLTWCADGDIPEVRTIDRWWPEIKAFVATGHSNAKSEGINRMIKLAARAVHDFRNPTNQRLRTRCVTHPLSPSPRPPPPRLNSKPSQTFPPEFVVRGPAERYAFRNRSGVRLYARTECTVESRVLRLDA
ncbi:transposase [Streptomyces jeddahensis]|uniref:transposase n=1 Tax=Streptomyces jeddahensis TaxID=1716141 RepID=UPI0012FF98A5|nr:transposase [Streptomyces jeddahensis]